MRSWIFQNHFLSVPMSWLQDPLLPIPKSTDFQVLYIKWRSRQAGIWDMIWNSCYVTFLVISGIWFKNQQTSNHFTVMKLASVISHSHCQRGFSVLYCLCWELLMAHFRKYLHYKIGIYINCPVSGQPYPYMVAPAGCLQQQLIFSLLSQS